MGLLVGVGVLIRHVGICLAIAVAIDLFWRGRRSAALGAVLATLLVLVPWIGWLIIVRHNTQAGLLAQGGLGERVARQALFYLHRIADQLTGPVVEVGTVFQRGKLLYGTVTLWAAVVTSIAVLGWFCSLQSRRRRLAGLVALITLALLLVWPFTEAGRFLIPLVPFLLVGLVEGAGRLFAIVRRSMRQVPLIPRWTPRVWAALAVLTMSVPYSVYAIASGRSDAQRRTHRDFDAACAWIVEHGNRPGPILTRHPGEVYWRTRHQALTPSTNDPKLIARMIDRYDIAFLLIDEERYANASTNPLRLYANRHPERVQRTWSHASGASSVTVYRVVPKDR